MTFDELVKRCKGAVYLTVNEHRSDHETIGDFCDLDEVDTQIRERLTAADLVYKLQFYPDSPLGFYGVYGISLDDVLRQAQDVLDNPAVEDSFHIEIT